MNIVYRLFGADGTLLYAGRTKWFQARLSKHKRDHGWWEQVARHTTEEIADDEAAVKREQDIIRQENPSYNQLRYPLRDPDAPRGNGPAPGYCRLPIDLPLETRRVLKILAAREDTSVAEIVRMAINAEIDKRGGSYGQ